jgi:hypothetical protein
MIVDNGYQLDEVFRNTFQNVYLNIQTIGENLNPIKAMVEFTRTIFNYLEKKKSKSKTPMSLPPSPPSLSPSLQFAPPFPPSPIVKLDV